MGGAAVGEVAESGRTCTTDARAAKNSAHRNGVPTCRFFGFGNLGCRSSLRQSISLRYTPRPSGAASQYAYILPERGMSLAQPAPDDRSRLTSLRSWNSQSCAMSFVIKRAKSRMAMTTRPLSSSSAPQAGFGVGAWACHQRVASNVALAYRSGTHTYVHMYYNGRAGEQHV
eukprot:2698832-Pyramimonas_sp.AAC.1